MSGCCAPTPAQNSFMRRARAGRLDDRRLHAGIGLHEQLGDSGLRRETVEEPTAQIWSRAAAPPEEA